MGQYWVILNLDKRERGPGVGAKLGEFIFNPLHQLVELFTVPVKSSDGPPPSLVPHNGEKRTLGYLAFPSELLRMVFNYIEAPEDVVRLTVVNKMLTVFGRDRLQELVMQAASSSSWSGGRIICLGDNASTLPPGMLTDTEKERLEGLRVSQEMDTASEVLYEIGSEGYRRGGQRDLTSNLCFSWTRPSDDLYTRWRISRRHRSRGSTLIRSVELTRPEGKIWVLCNISKREYVRVDALASITNASPESAFINDGCNLGMAIVILTAWTYEGGDEDVGCGPWAGDRLQIIPFDTLADAEGWKDISSTAVRLINHCRSYYGIDDE
ncbi:hypothetical protein OF83DRAFT_358192 [Amylostereum chailletii]|nr:hypothetical protein OF83DRAFT_358192 [Amylostereum chailletii]